MRNSSEHAEVHIDFKYSVFERISFTAKRLDSINEGHKIQFVSNFNEICFSEIKISGNKSSFFLIVMLLIMLHH